PTSPTLCRNRCARTSGCWPSRGDSCDAAHNLGRVLIGTTGCIIADLLNTVAGIVGEVLLDPLQLVQDLVQHLVGQALESFGLLWREKLAHVSVLQAGSKSGCDAY